MGNGAKLIGKEVSSVDCYLDVLTLLVLLSIAGCGEALAAPLTLVVWVLQ
jgi:hypothetical protein